MLRLCCDCVDNRRMSSAISALSSFVRLSIATSVPSQLGVAPDIPGAPADRSAVPESRHSVVDEDCSSTVQHQNRLPHHRYSFPTTPITLPLSRPTELATQQWTFNRDRPRASLPVKQSPQQDGRRKQARLQELIMGCVAPASPDDCTSDAENCFLERTRVASVTRRELDSADVHASSPVNSTGVHIVINTEQDHDDVTSADDVTALDDC